MNSEKEVTQILEDQKPLDIETIIDTDNVATLLNEATLIGIGDQVCNGFDVDLVSRAPWEKDLTQWTKMALQVTEEKTFPWPNAANIQFPLLATAAMQFAARAYPALVPSQGDVVKCKVVGRDLDGTKAERAKRIT